MSAVRLNWRSLPYAPERFFVVGTEVAAAYVPGTLSRFAVYETRGHPRKDGPGDVFYTVRDAATVGDDEVRDGKRPSVVGQFATPDEAITWARGQV